MKKKFTQKKCLLKCIILLINSILYFIIIKIDKMKLIIPKKKNILLDNRNLRLEILKKGKNYIDKCLKGFCNYSNYTKVIKVPLISVIIPIFNCENTINATIRSIQNQNLTAIEIILVNDFSNDNSLKIVKFFQKEDLRIKIINNNKNMGTLYSRCIGVLMSKAKFIFPLDNDDMFFDEDVLDYIYNIGNKGNLDIVEFKTILINNYNDNITTIKDHPFSYHKSNLIHHQPELRLFPIYKNGKYGIYDINIWGKCIKTEIYKKSVNSLGIKRYSNFVSWAEDTLMVFILFNIAQSFIFIYKYGVIHLNCSSTASFTQPQKIRMFGEIFLIDIYFDYLKNDTSKNYVAEYVLEKAILKNIKDKKNIIYFKTILKKILESNYINKLNKEKIKNSFAYLF